LKLDEFYTDFKNRIIHKSHLQRFIRCPAKLRFLELEVEQPELVKIEKDEHSKRLMAKGSFFHDFTSYFGVLTNQRDFYELIERYHYRNELTPLDTESVAILISGYSLPINEMRDKESPFVRYYSLVDAYIRFEAERLTALDDVIDFNERMLLWKPVAVEKEISKTVLVELPEKLVEEFAFDTFSIKVKGTIDRINRFDLDKKQLEVMEYKTGNWNSKSSSKKTNVRRELGFYGYFFSPYKIAGDYWNFTQLSCYNPEAPEAINYMSESIGTRTTNAMLRQMVKLHLALEEDNFDQPTCNPFICMWCDYLNSCGKYYKYQWDSARDGSFQTAKFKRQNERK